MNKYINNALRIACLLLASLVFATTANALLTVRITQSAKTKIPIAIGNFNHDDSRLLQTVIVNNLNSVGEFAATAELPVATSMGQPINFQPYQQQKIPYLVVGNLNRQPQTLELAFELYDTSQQKRLLGYKYTIDRAASRAVAHRISDLIYEQIIKAKGIFATKIAFVSVNQQPPFLYRLQIADADGHNEQTLLRSQQPIMSPTFSADGNSIAYVSFRNRTSEIYSLELKTGSEQLLAAGKGIFAAPSFSPDGKYLAYSSSVAGSSDIYVLNLATRRQFRLTNSYAIETEPVWSSDSKRIFFTSNQSGAPQIYAMDFVPNSSILPRKKRISFAGKYNAAATVSSSGANETVLKYSASNALANQVATVHGQGGSFKIALLDLKRDSVRILTSGAQDESPSFAPNGRHILYAAKQGNRGVLKIVSSDGKTKRQLTTNEGDIREPAWSGYRH